MNQSPTGLPPSHGAKVQELNERWHELCARYLPVHTEGSVWRYSRDLEEGDPAQGWKLHVSATVLNAHRVLGKVSPLLSSRGVLFKAPSTLALLRRINSGLHHAYSQVGKIITVYPRTDGEAVRLARSLHRLTRGFAAPAVPFDLQYRSGSNVYYRYGGFKPLSIEHPDGTTTQAIRDPQGNLVPDLRAPGRAKPEWAEDPFTTATPPRANPPEMTPLATTYRAFGALVQRGKGGVYRAVDFSAEPPRLCLLKEGRRAGELDWDGRDGRWRTRHEGRVLSLLRERGVSVPRVYAWFEAEGNYYIVTEFIDGETLQDFLYRRRRRLPFARALRLALRMADFVTQIHAAGWVWGDCKPANLIVTPDGELRPLDFEGASPLGQAEIRPWTTPAFAPPGSAATGSESPPEGGDLYALGVIIYLLLTGRMPEPDATPTPVERVRRNVPMALRALVAELLRWDGRACPCAREVAARLRRALADLEGGSKSAAADPGGRWLREVEPPHERGEAGVPMEA